VTGSLARQGKSAPPDKHATRVAYARVLAPISRAQTLKTQMRLAKPFSIQEREALPARRDAQEDSEEEGPLGSPGEE